jgi:hypothetical protein
LTENPLADIVECCRRLEGWEVVNDDSLIQIPCCCNPAKDTLVQFALIPPIKIGVFQCYGSTFVVDDFFLCAEFHFFYLVFVFSFVGRLPSMDSTIGNLLGFAIIILKNIFVILQKSIDTRRCR